MYFPVNFAQFHKTTICRTFTWGGFCCFFLSENSVVFTLNKTERVEVYSREKLLSKIK